MLKNLLIKYYFCRFLKRNKFTWEIFLLPTTLQINPFVMIILEPINDKILFNKMKLGLHEALVNAAKHGNLNNPKKFIRVRRVITPNWFVLQIQDEGTGSSFESRKTTLPLEIDAEGGRGFFLISKSFDDIRWNKRGNRIQLACKK